ncbi:hypothetical protein GU926_03945 [Nibribacter ruber]|uniref:Putative auto-transporter adhesin head GIN domain-containing protein n=1 Tax=Nibribacter ruber TaxID=2698458 RepID=A0A6P1NS25_9BACT|nr:head GIN domain-containing protein [Nibribacter ruber]QHL86636.1 hypothetical protein GU926_03945 [Nibribacter ruber]
MNLLRFSFLSTCFCLSLAFTSCDILADGPCLQGSGEVREEVRDMASFTGVDLRIPGKVFLIEGPQRVRVEAYQDILKEVKTEVVSNTLVIRSDACLEYADEETKFYISMPHVENVELKSSGQIYVQSVPSPDKLRLTMSGSGFIDYSGNLKKLYVLHSGSGDVDLFGSTSYLESTLSGSGRLRGFAMATDSAKTTLTGSGYQQVWVNNFLEVIITGTGNVYYRGQPWFTSTYTTSSGKLIDSNK